MKNLLTRGGIETIAVFIGISGGLWSEKQSELNKIIKSEETALISIKEALVSDSTSVYWIIKSLEKELENTDLFLKHISKDTVLSEKELNTRMWDLAYFQYLVQDKSIYESQIKNAGKKIVQVDSVSAAISNVYDYLYKHLDNIFIMQKELSTKTVEAFTDAGGYMDSKRFSITNSLNIDQSAMFSSSFQNLKFISQLTFHYDTNFFIKRQYERGLKIISSAIESIETYLDSKK